MDKRVAIVLGGTVPHKYLINNLKERGFYTILIDYYSNPPAKTDADEHIQESTLDKEKVLEIAKNRNASLVISGCVDQANVTACYVSEKIGLHVPYSYETALRVTDKKLMKEGMVKAGIPTANYQLVTEENLNSFVNKGFPKVVKPCDCNGSKGVRKVTNEKEQKEAIEYAIQLSRTRKVIIEDFKQGTEISIYAYISKGKGIILYSKAKKLPNIDKKSALQSFVSIGPFSFSNILKEKVLRAIELISNEFNLDNTPILIQAIVNHDNFDIIEFAPRVGGGLAFREIKIQTGFDFIDAVILSYLGETPIYLTPRPSNNLCSVVHFYGKKGKLQEVQGLDKLVANGTIEEYHLHKSPGMVMTIEDLASRNRVFGVLVLSKDTNEIKNKLELVVKKVKILNTENENVLLKISFEEISIINYI